MKSRTLGSRWSSFPTALCSWPTCHCDGWRSGCFAACTQTKWHCLRPDRRNHDTWCKASWCKMMQKYEKPMIKSHNIPQIFQSPEEVSYDVTWPSMTCRYISYTFMILHDKPLGQATQFEIHLAYVEFHLAGRMWPAPGTDSGQGTWNIMKSYEIICNHMHATSCHCHLQQSTASYSTHSMTNTILWANVSIVYERSHLSDILRSFSILPLLLPGSICPYDIALEVLVAHQTPSCRIQSQPDATDTNWSELQVVTVWAAPKRRERKRQKNQGQSVKWYLGRDHGACPIFSKCFKTFQALPSWMDANKLDSVSICVSMIKKQQEEPSSKYPKQHHGCLAVTRNEAILKNIEGILIYL